MKMMTKRAGAMSVLSAAAMALILAGCGGPSSGGSTSGGGGGGGGSTVATVNGEAISRDDFNAYLEATNGERALRELIDNKLVLQEAAKQKIEITDKDIDAVIEQRKAEGGSGAQMAEEVTKIGGVQLTAYRNSIRNQIAIDRLVTKDVKVDDKALQEWFTKNKANYSTPARVKLGLLITTSKPRADIMVQQLKAKTKTFAQLVDEQKKQKDQAAMQSTAENPNMTSVDALPADIKSTVQKLKVGETSGALLLTPAAAPQKVYGILRIVAQEAAKNPTLAEIRPTVETDYKLEQIARKLVKENPKNPPFEETIRRTGGALMQQNMQQGIFQQPTRRDILRYINQTAVAQLTSKLQTGAQVTSDDPAYAKLVEAYKPPVMPGAPAPAGAQPGGAQPAPAPTGGPAPK